MAWEVLSQPRHGHGCHPLPGESLPGEDASLPWRGSFARQAKSQLRSLAWRFNADRMVMDYVTKTYVPAAGGLSCSMDMR